MLKPKVFESVLVMLFLLLCGVMYLALASGTSPGFNAWNTTSSGQVSSIVVGGDGTLYVFSGEQGDNISALGADGHLRWKLVLPNNWGIADRFVLNPYNRIEYSDMTLFSDGVFSRSGQISVTNGDRLYLLVGETGPLDPGRNVRYDHDGTYDPGSFSEKLVAISPEGRVLWKTPIGGTSKSRLAAASSYQACPASLYSQNSFLYVYDDFSVTVLDDRGTILSTVGDVDCDPTVDSEGNLYVVKSDGLLSENVLESYAPNGTLRWHKILSSPVNLTSSRPDSAFNSILLYHSGTLYVPVINGIYALDPAGNTLWEKNYDGLNYGVFSPMPVDKQGNLYLQLNSYPPFLDVVSPGGVDNLRPLKAYDATYRGGQDGVVYYVTYALNASPEGMTLGELRTANLQAYDVLHDQLVWNLTLPLDANSEYSDVYHSSILDPPVPLYATERHDPSGQPGRAIVYGHYRDASLDAWKMEVPDHFDSLWGVRLVCGNGLIYVNYYVINQEQQADKISFTYSDNLYALDNNGTLLWKKPIMSPVTSMAVNNSTLYYGTQDGRLFAENTGLVAGGFALAAAFYLLIRFFLAGTVARAKDRLNKNENRNRIIKYVADYPGSNLRDISRGLMINLGTVRYHMLILGINRKISAFQADDKHVRYFPASSSYSTEDRLVISLARRNGMKRVLALLIEKEGLSNADLSRELNLKESAVSRYMKQLTSRGIVERQPGQGGSLAYSIPLQHRDRVIKVINEEKD